MTGRMTGKVAVITGGAGGMGEAAARRFAAEGAAVVLADINAAAGHAVASSIGDAARFVRCDVRNESDLAAAAQTAVEEYGGMDAMLHFAASGGVQDRIEDMDVDAWDDTIAVILRGSMLAVKVAIRPLRARGGGSITLTSSVAGLRPNPASPAGYTSGKAALSGLVKVAAMQCAADLIRVNLLVPGGVPTPMHLTRFGYSLEMATAMAAHLDQLLFDRFQPLPRSGSAADVASAALYLASDDAAWVTGVELPVDGGLMVHQLTTPDDYKKAVAEAEARVRARSGSAIRRGGELMMLDGSI